jgi:hypothetical protein
LLLLRQDPTETLSADDTVVMVILNGRVSIDDQSSLVHRCHFVSKTRTTLPGAYCAIP